jgi:DNA-binding MarR family transcriptional regulator
LPREDLTPREKATLFGMVRFPSYNDRELSEALNARMSTVTSIRARLMERGLFSRAMVPSLRALGAGVLSICYGGVSCGHLVDIKQALDRGLSRLDGYDSFYALVGSLSWLEMGAFRNYTEAQRMGEGMWRRFCDLSGGMPGQPCARSHYPMELVQFHNYFDHAPLVARLLAARGDPVLPRRVPPAVARRLSPVERLVLYGMVKRPGASDKEIAGGLGVSRQAVARVRRLLVKEGRLMPVVIPNLRMLGFELLAFFHFRLDACKAPEAQEGAVRQILEGIPHIFAMSAGPEVLVLGAYSSQSGFEKGSIRLIRGLEGACLLDGSPVVLTFPVGDTVAVKDHDYVQFVKAMLGLKIQD